MIENKNRVLNTMPSKKAVFAKSYPFIGVSPHKKPPTPKLLIHVIGPNNQLKAKEIAFIDSGANNCFLTRSMAKELKINWRKGDKKTVIDAAGKRRRGYQHFLTIEIYGVQLNSSPDNLVFTETPEFVIEDVPVIFTRRLRESILGIEGFLDRYIYVVNHAKKRFSVHAPNKDSKCEVCKPG